MMILLFLLISAALLVIGESAVSKNATHPYVRPIPLLYVSLHEDRTDYLPRLLRSIDYDVNRIVIQVGNEDATVVETIVRKVLNVSRDMPHLTISIITRDVNPGCANGFNLGLRGLVGDLNSTSTAPPLLQSMAKGDAINDVKSHTPVAFDPDDWVLIVNSDIAFYPGTLRNISVSVEQQLHDDSLFGIGFTSLCCSVEWSAIIVTRRLINRIGYFDENIYPAAWEDDDYSIRVALSGMHAARFDHTPLLHGERDGSKVLWSGSNIAMTSTIDHNNNKWKKLFTNGWRWSLQYMKSKWGRRRCKPTDCKLIEGMNSQVYDHDKPVPFKHPFGDASKPLWYWQLDQPRRDALLQAAQGPYDSHEVLESP